MASRLKTLWNGRMIAHPRRCHPMKFHLSPRGRDESGHNYRTPNYGWFTEGFNTPDLKEAKAPLAELSWPTNS
jgi:hypothetical protein